MKTLSLWSLLSTLTPFYAVPPVQDAAISPESRQPYQFPNKALVMASAIDLLVKPAMKAGRGHLNTQK